MDVNGGGVVVPLFDVTELKPMPNARRAEAGLMFALEEAAAGNRLDKTTAGLVGGALIAARALDRAEALPDKTAVYAVAQLLPPFQRALEGLGLTVDQSAPAGDAPPPAVGAPSWVSDEFGTPS